MWSWHFAADRCCRPTLPVSEPGATTGFHECKRSGILTREMKENQRAMVPSDLPYTSEEEMLADQFARNSRLVVECTRHPGRLYRAYSRLETINRIDACLNDKNDRLLALIKRNELQKKALIVIVLRNYPDECPQCRLH